MMRIIILAATLSAAALPAFSADADAPGDGARCVGEDRHRFWKSLDASKMTSGDRENGVDWGKALDASGPDTPPSPFVWLALHESKTQATSGKTKDSPLTFRTLTWSHRKAAAKCIYLSAMREKALERLKEYEALTGWDKDDKLAPLLGELKKEEPDFGARDLAMGWHRKFERMLGWLRQYGYAGNEELAEGTQDSISRLQAAFNRFKKESGHYAKLAKGTSAARLDSAQGRHDLRVLLETDKKLSGNLAGLLAPSSPLRTAFADRFAGHVAAHSSDASVLSKRGVDAFAFSFLQDLASQPVQEGEFSLMRDELIGAHDPKGRVSAHDDFRGKMEALGNRTDLTRAKLADEMDRLFVEAAKAPAPRATPSQPPTDRQVEQGKSQALPTIRAAADPASEAAPRPRTSPIPADLDLGKSINDPAEAERIERELGAEYPLRMGQAGYRRAWETTLRIVREAGTLENALRGQILKDLGNLGGPKSIPIDRADSIIRDEAGKAAAKASNRAPWKGTRLPDERFLAQVEGLKNRVARNELTEQQFRGELASILREQDGRWEQIDHSDRHRR
ncbi:MAG: hypothetical protein WC943_07880 [Elusimicrobiota bacterium]|jgi:hypothetical protein